MAKAKRPGPPKKRDPKGKEKGCRSVTKKMPGHLLLKVLKAFAQNAPFILQEIRKITQIKNKPQNPQL